MPYRAAAAPSTIGATRSCERVAAARIRIVPSSTISAASGVRGRHLHRSFLPVDFRSPQKGSYRRLLLTDNRGPPGTVLRCATNGARGPYK